MNNSPNTQQPSKFSHPAEEAFAKILDFYGTRWEYEPKTFPLEWDETGKVTQAFSPDFYLPDENVYIEITTLRPRLDSIKNQKLRKMNKLYPEIKIKLFKRSDIRSLLIKFGLESEARNYIGSDSQKRE